MKNRFTCYMLLATTAIASVRCSQDDDQGQQTVSCLPTTLPGYTSTLTISYNADKKISTVNYTEDDTPGYQSSYLYANGNITRINTMQGGATKAYETFTSGSGTITESHFAKVSNQFKEDSRITYYLNGTRITAWADHNPYNGLARRDSVVFTYTGENITRKDSYGSSENIENYFLYTYDDKTNPFKLAGLNDEDDEYFKPINISKNNVTRMEFHFGEHTDHDNFTYTYDSDGLPITRAITWGGILEDPTQTISYTCD
ncbi:hypothetical protein KK062_19005 [Fulvivirgaceae bacterium PWU5]|uniref:DUF4595 domain-containing protein n=1 Tax=Dawidia cretensis TaxID=2782350 RepID=A0AAP2E2H7_9BACT|nr:hypothetical protein [Dawidia cretensis]MBT1710344.1 hypothetical protein [Dawidia cretensis]